jgi:hypothetical protein
MYGIQQIFGFRLGKSRVSSLPLPNFSFKELEIQFGQELLREHAILSQMHVIEPASVGSAWLVGRSAIMPLDIMSGALPNGSEVDLREAKEYPRCELSIRNVRGVVWETFDGLLCDFSHFAPLCAAEEHIVGRELQFNRSYRRVRLFLDANPEVRSFDDESYSFHTTPGEEVVDRLNMRFPDGQLKILLLGMRSSNYAQIMVGLLLLPKDEAGVHYYRRLGFCFWSCKPKLEPGSELLLDGRAPFWQQGTGLFG